MAERNVARTLERRENVGCNAQHTGDDPVQLLLDTCLFADLTPAEVAPLALAGTPVSRRAGEAVYRAGDRADAVFIVRGGLLTEYVETVDGDELATDVLTAGDLFGEVSIFAPTRDRTVSVLATADTELLRLSREIVVPFLFAHPAAMTRLLESLADMVRCATDLAATAAYVPIKHRVALYLAELATRNGRDVPGGVLIELPLPQAHIAAAVGASRPNVNRALQELIAAGELTRQDRQYLLADPTRIRLRYRGSDQWFHRHNRR
jgi:CRP-like cAMP-binding protein